MLDPGAPPPQPVEPPTPSEPPAPEPPTTPIGPSEQPTADFSVPSSWDFPAVDGLLPFGHGVASGDPLADRVILWTRISIPDARGWLADDPQGFTAVDVEWVIASDPQLANVVRGGRVQTGPSLDWTVKIDADGLTPATTYYYAFRSLRRTSPIGRTRTAPAAGDGTAELRVVNVSCTSFWSMDFHPYSRIAERNDLDLLVNAGDHVYEFVDTKQWYRARNDRFDLDYVDFRKWVNARECGRRYALYYADPDLLLAHQALAWTVLGDNHDLDNETDPDTGIEFTREDAARVFWLWTPCRPPRTDGTGEFPLSPGPDTQVTPPGTDNGIFLYRNLRYGDLADVIHLDMRNTRDSAGTTPMGTMLGDSQANWLKAVMVESDTRTAWRFVVNQINMSQLAEQGAPAAAAAVIEGVSGQQPPSNPDFYPGWGNFPGARQEFFGHLRSNSVLDNIVLSGDSHGWFAYDLVEDNQAPNYEPVTGGGTLGAVGVELVPSAFGRANGQSVIANMAYEQANGGPPEDDYDNFQQNFYPQAEGPTIALEQSLSAATPNLQYFNWRTFGYGLHHITAEQHLMELWEVPYPQRSNEQTLIQQFSNQRGAPHLTPQAVPTPTAGARIDQPAPPPQQSADANAFVGIDAQAG